MSVMIDLMEGGLLPDTHIRREIRRLLKLRLRDECHGDTEVERQRQREFFALLRNSPLAVATEGEDNWMGRYFFTGEIMPSDHLLFYFNDHLLVEDHWRVNGRHYQQTCEDWLMLQDARREQIMPILQDVYGENAELWFQRWRVFFMACAELFGYNNGNEWFVGHYLLRKVSC